MITAPLVEKYDGLANGFAERTWANLEFDMRRRFILAANWGRVLEAGDSLIELGCGDGYLAQLLIKHGYAYQGLDVSEQMIAMADRRLAEGKLTARLRAIDVNYLVLNQPIDAVISYMGAFFTFIHDPLALLQRLRPDIRKKIIVDLNPRGAISIRAAIRMLDQAGFQNIRWRPFFVPVTVKLPAASLKTLGLLETVPVLRSLPLRWKFNVLLKAEVGS